MLSEFGPGHSRTCKMQREFLWRECKVQDLTSGNLHPASRASGSLFLQSCTRPPREPHRSLAVVPSIRIEGTTARLRGDFGETMGGLRACKRGWAGQNCDGCATSGSAFRPAKPGDGRSPRHGKSAKREGRGESQRDSISQPRVASSELPWVHVPRVPNPVGVGRRQTFSQGSSLLACWAGRHNPFGIGDAMGRERGRGRGPLLGHRSSRQCAGRCESKWPCRLSAHHTGQCKAR